MLSNVLMNSNDRLSSLACCKPGGSECNCLGSLQDDYWHQPDSYNCEKKMTTYVLRFGASYASEIYHYFNESNFKEKIDPSRPLNIISLGCGFSPDFFALKKYLQDNFIDVPVSYRGFDNSNCWDFARPQTEECNYLNINLTSPFNLEGADVVIMSKVFSTLHRNGLADKFLCHLKDAVIKTLRHGAILVFIDVNHIDMGRDIFHENVKTYMPDFYQYYFNGYTGNNWTKIQQSDLVFTIPDQLTVPARRSTGSTVIFEYRK